MLSLEELERLSRFASGDLAQSERRQVEVELRSRPDLARALLQFRRLDEILNELEAEPSSQSDELLIRQVVRQRRTGKWLVVAVAAAIVVSAGTVLAFRYGRSGAEHLEASSVDAVRPSIPELAAQSAELSGPQTLHAANAELLLLTGAKARVNGPEAVALAEGGIVVDGQALVIANRWRIAVDGLAAVTMEPGDVFVHVMQRLQSTPQGKDIQMRLSSWSGPPVVIGAASVALLVATGSAEVQAANGERTQVNAGQSWSPSVASRTLVAREESVRSKSEDLAAERWAEFVQKMNALSDGLQPSTPALIRCYKQGLAQDPNLEGSIIAHLTLVTGPDGKGRVAEATIAKDYSLASPFVASCVLKEVSGAPVPAPAGGTDALDLAFYFHRGDSGREPWVQIASSGHASAAPPREAAQTAQTAQTVSVGDAPSRGPSGAAVTVLEISDPECPYCGRAHESINTLYKEFGDRVRFALKFAPLPFHRRAPTAAAAALAAGEQGKFWEYVDAMFAHPDAIDRAGLERVAVQLGLDMKQFNDALDTNRFRPAIEAAQNQAKSLGVNGVPVFYINGSPLVGARPINEMRAKILEALNGR